MPVTSSVDMAPVRVSASSRLATPPSPCTRSTVTPVRQRIFSFARARSSMMRDARNSLAEVD